MNNNTQRQTPQRADIYCRVSMDDQEDNTSLESQEAECRAYAAQHGIIVVNVYKEVYTGTLYRERKLLSVMRESYRSGQTNAVIIRTFDRLSRNQTHFAVLVDEMQHHRIELLCVKEQFDNTPMGQFTRMVLAFVAELEREKIVERTVTGKRNRALNGALIPGGIPMYGYSWPSINDKTRYIINEQQAIVVRRIYALHREGKSIYRITQILQAEGHKPSRGGMWSEASVRNILHNRFYTGKAHAYRYSQPLKNKLEGRGRNICPLEEQDTFTRRHCTTYHLFRGL